MLVINNEQITAEELFEALPELFFAYDTSGKTVYLSNKWETLFGLTIQKQDKFASSIIHPDDLGATLMTIGKAFQSKQVCEFDYRLKLLTGEYHWYSVYLAPIFRNKVLLGWIGNVIDVQEQREILQMLEESDKRKDEFIGMASHELKTPITSTKMLLQIVQKQLNKEGQDEASLLIDKAELQINRLTRLVNDLLDVSRIKAGQLTLTKEIVDFDQYLKNTVSSISSDNHKLNVSSHTRARIALDTVRMSQVISNLIQNAIKYSPDAKKVEVKAISDGTKITISVQDFGIGIPKERQSNVFDRFYRVEEQVGETFSGLGLGLYIAAEIVHLHKGRIWVESKIHDGSTFYFTLPL